MGSGVPDVGGDGISEAEGVSEPEIAGADKTAN